jgi:hypothetical protein
MVAEKVKERLVAVLSALVRTLAGAAALHAARV